MNQNFNFKNQAQQKYYSKYQQKIDQLINELSNKPFNVQEWNKTIRRYNVDKFMYKVIREAAVKVKAENNNVVAFNFDDMNQKIHQIKNQQAINNDQINQVFQQYNNNQLPETVAYDQFYDYYQQNIEDRINQLYQNLDDTLRDKYPKYNETDQRYENYWIVQLIYYEFDENQQVGQLVYRYIPITQSFKADIKNAIFGLIDKHKVVSDQYDDYRGFQLLLDVNFIPVNEYTNTLIQNQGNIIYNKRQGSYFNYQCKINCLKNVLTLLQIGTVDMTEGQLDTLNQLHCLPYALQQLLPHEEYQEIFNRISNGIQFKKDYLKNLYLKKPLVVYQWEDGQIRGRRLNPGENQFIKNTSNLKTDNDIQLGLYMNHYFVFIYTGITEKWINNWPIVQQLYQEGVISQEKFEQYQSNFNLSDFKIKTLSNGQKEIYMYFRTPLQKTLTSLHLIKYLMDNGLFEQIKQLNGENFNILKKSQLIHPIIQEEGDERLYNKAVDTQLIQRIQQENYHDIIDADFEAFTKNQSNQNIRHKPFLLCAVSTYQNYEFVEDLTAGQDLIYKLLCDINAKYNTKQKTFLIRFYNLTYDRNFIFNGKFYIENLVNSGTKTVCFQIRCGGNTFRFIDNLLMYNTKLKNLPDMFFNDQEKQNIHKEFFPYTYYTEELYKNGVGSIDDALKHMADVQKEDFIQSIKHAKAYISDKAFDVRKYASYYCLQDVKVQRLANIHMNELSKEKLNLSSDNFISISSLSLAFFKNSNCFQNCYMSHGLVRQYIQQFVCGGRCMVANNGKYKTTLKIQDFDARSLYPSAMRRCYYPTGLPKKLSQEQINYYNNPDNLFKITENQDSEDQRTLFLTVELKKGPNFINRMFPVVDNGGQDESRVFSNDQEGQHFLTHIRLQDAVKYQNYTYTIIDGLYFEGRNYTINDVIQFVYDQRNECKKQQKQFEKQGQMDSAAKYKGLQTMYKLIMNSSYGKCIEKLHDKHNTIFNQKDGETVFQNLNVLNYISRNFFQITDIQTFNDQKCIDIQTQKQILDDEWNFNQCGVLILDYSKRIMNEVMCLAEDLKIKMFYQDTDSIHMEDSKVELLCEEYKKKYGRELIGSKLGQFHSDFESKTGQEVLYSDLSIFCGKKCYVDRMKLEDGSYEFKTCMKGIPQVCIENHSLGILGVYEALYQGQKVNFNLAQFCVCMDFNNKSIGKYSVINRNEFQREVKFLKAEDNEELMYQFQHQTPENTDLTVRL